MSDATLRVRVARKWSEARDICGLELASADGSPLPAFDAGAHIDVHLPGGFVRQYSLCNDPAERGRYEIAVLREASGRGGSAAVHDVLAQGQELQIGGPRNLFPVVREGEHHLLLAGGIGITPIVAMAEQLCAAGKSFMLHYCARTPERTAFRERIARSRFSVQARIHYDDGAPEQRFDAASVLAAAAPGTHLYVCGPRGFIDAMLDAARVAGWPETQLHFESFSAGNGAAAPGETFAVRVSSSGLEVPVPADRTVIQALAAHGIEVLTSCEQGVCGTCLTRVLAGEPDHRDQYLTDEERTSGCFLPCVSRGKGTLVLDL
ncbi:PDR/VanB family oxidoreductase [Trinickia caryophylli]|uniref:Vanillate O-demethylase ferredoxin subunit n=1 Tax=Trinickia caryophylli TaxID=28094 RepID=A0A1X7CJA0_TRICW|nr:PDR/VanB family oxidoreductase [Trinickia caryophylli]PMS11515.1 oxidoreductase [Trinickia caryophylli]TRX19934.1 oxidoreductase [Trinickia caryophylli]WQE12730.1 PDR/VanB family oxidoreductase [Trinickia caryophylli]SME97334.1 vanillate O-demethylase ferredoxin subunit [Trinickia caryophylli]GLU30437.1 vanillate O-demethylase oxidoreductase [Trinickia caryophylli]